MDEEFLKLPVDNTLTIHSAYGRGYKHVLDIEPATSTDLLEDFIRLVKQQGFKLGKSRYIRMVKGAEQDRGLYEPLKKLGGNSQPKK